MDGIIQHNCNSKEGSSGSPIMSLDSYKVIGVHLGKGRFDYKNGIFIKNIIHEFNNKNNKNINENGDYYIKEFKLGNSLSHLGIIYFKYGNYYIGECENKIQKGIGIIYNNNKEMILMIYEGILEEGKYNGKGKYIYENGDYYEGEFKDDLKNNVGTEYYKNNKIKYEGEFRNDKYEGVGKYIYENGDYYEGEWLNGEKSGIGILYENEEIRYERFFKYGKYNGYGKEYDPKTKSYYIGNWLYNLKQGNGTEYYKDGKTIKYTGNFANGKYEGKGTYYFTNGESLECTWSNGLKNGKGIFCDKNGTIQREAFFENDKEKESK